MLKVVEGGLWFRSLEGLEGLACYIELKKIFNITSSIFHLKTVHTFPAAAFPLLRILAYQN